MTQRVVNYTYGTGNPVLPDGSIDVRDGIDNLQSLDVFMNADEDSYNQRDGEIVKTLAGAVRSVGVDRIGDFTAGCTVTARNQGVLYETGGTVYVWLGALPKVVPPASSPSSTGGIGPSGWLDVGDASAYGRIIDTLSSDTGDTNVYGKGSITGQVKRTQAERNADEISIYDFGGVDDWNGTSGTNNLNAIAQYTTHLISNGGGVLRLPKKGTGAYYVSGTDGSIPEIDGIEIFADEGVSLVVTAGLRLLSRGVKCNREIPILVSNSLKYNATISSNQFKRPSEQFPGLDQTCGVSEVPSLVSSSDIFGYDITNPAARSGISITQGTNSVTTPNASATQKLVFATPAKIGEQINCYTTFGGIGVMGVLTVNKVVTFEVDSGSGASLINDNGNVLGVAAVDPVGLTRNRLNSGLMSVVVTGQTTFSVLVNNVHLYSYDAKDPIISVCFGNKGNTSPVTFSGVSRISGLKSVGARPLRIICLGDSTSQPDISQGSQFDYMRQFLASAGCQVQYIKNMAVGGETSGQQLARFNAENISGYDFCIAQLGINDIQSGVAVSAYAANMAAIADKCAANNVKLIASIPTSWYPQSEAAPYGQIGQDTTNSSMTAPYVAALITTMASKGQLVSSQSVKHEGLVGASWLNVSGADSVLMDNIHPTAYGRMMMGLGNAKAILGAIMPTSHSVTTATASGPARWKTSFTSASADVPSAIISNEGIRLVGKVSIASIPVNGTSILKLDKEISPTSLMYFNVLSLTSGGPLAGGTVAVSTSGDVTCFSIPAGTVSISFNMTLPFRR
ncbi:MAG: GDSL-type esterase/lipase family protein [Plesiomonas sp.]